MPLSNPVSFELVEPGDFEALLALRIAAMRDSLERLGRFDPARARARFAANFVPEHTRHIVVDGARVGFFALRPQGSGLLLDHLYIAPEHQARGIGGAVMRRVHEQADAASLAVEVGALKGSDANRFYRRHGFLRVRESEWDNHYVRPARTVRRVRALWDAYQARDWNAARALLVDRAVAVWWTSGERFDGAAAIVKVNAIYPEGWSIRVIEINALADGRVMSIVRVDHAPHCFFATSIFDFDGAHIARIDEYWATVETPADWRSPQAIGQYSRFDPCAPTPGEGPGA